MRMDTFEHVYENALSKVMFWLCFFLYVILACAYLNLYSSSRFLLFCTSPRFLSCNRSHVCLLVPVFVSALAFAIWSICLNIPCACTLPGDQIRLTYCRPPLSGALMNAYELTFLTGLERLNL